MKKQALTLLLLAPSASFGFMGPGQPIDGPEQHCYGMAMVGYDSVINSRLGVKPEHALELAKVTPVSATSNVSFQPYLLKVVLDAYLWDTSPHNYAVKVMYNCAMNDVRMQTAEVAAISPF